MNYDGRQKGNSGMPLASCLEERKQGKTKQKGEPDTGPQSVL